MTEPYTCKEHAFVTYDLKAAKRHVQGHTIDLVLDAFGKYLKMRMGILPTEQLCNCRWAPIPHKHATTWGYARY